VEGVGYATIMEILSGTVMSPWFLLLLAALKLLATCLSLGSGASGGVFSPALFMGATVGAAGGYLCQWLMPNIDISIATFAIAGMAAAIAGTTGAVLTGIIMLAEMTRDFPSVLPMIITCTTAYAVRKAIMHESVYTMKLLARGHTVPEGLHAAMLTTQRIADMMTTDFAVVATRDTVSSATTTVVTTENGLIDSVYIQTAAAGDNATGRKATYALVPLQATPLAALTALCETGADLVLVTRQADTHRAEDIVGQLSPAILAGLLKSNEQLS
jgi:CIC family chloride channel protein